MRPSDAVVRADAIDPSRSFLVQAPAGSGKTELLTDRILALLALVQQPEEIVAITFTRAAAAEMHARVIEKLHAALGPEPAEGYKKTSWRLAKQALANDAKQNWQLLSHPSRLSIRTIDSLCAHLVKAMPWLSGLGGVPEVSDQADSLYSKAAQATMALADRYPSIVYLIQHLGVNLADVEQLLVDMLAKRDQWLPTLGAVDALSQLQHYLEDTIRERLQQLEQALPYGWQQSLAPCAVYAHQHLVLSQKHYLAPLADWSEQQPLVPEPEDLPRWQALIPLLLTSDLIPRKSQGMNAKVGFPAGGNKALNQQMKDWLDQEGPNPPWLAPLVAIRNLPAAYSEKEQELLQHLAQVLWIAVAQLRLAFIESGQVDFIEIAQRALVALGEADNPSDLLLRLDRRISHLLVDEFQDTSLNQIQLLEKLTSGWQPGDGRTVFLVGDPMQSIYRFRKAEVGLFLEVQKNQRLGEVSLEAVTLTNNFRSTQNVVQWVNQLGQHLFPAQHDLELGGVPYTPSDAFNPADPNSQVVTHPFIYEPNQKDLAQAQAEQRVVELCQQALSTYAESPKPVAILVRARSHLGQVIRALTKAGIPTKAVDIDQLTARPVVQDVVQLVRALSHPGDRLAWLALLRSPLCGLTLHSLHRLCGHDRVETVPQLIQQATAEAWPTDEWQRLQHVAGVLLDEGNRSGSMPFAAWVEYCWLRLGGDQVYADPNDQADAENVFRLLEQLAPYGDIDLTIFEQQVERLFAQAQLADHAVEVMTFHKAKGLEFESVILYDLNRGSRHQKEPLMAFEQSQGRLYVGMAKASDAQSKDPISLFIAEREKQREAYELQRLLYVGVTRARSELHLVAIMENKTNFAPTRGSLLDLLWPMVEVDFANAQAEQVMLPIPVEEPGTAPYQYLVRVADLTDLPVVTARPISQGDNKWTWIEEPFKEAAIGTVAHAWLERIGKEGRQAWPVSRIEQSVFVIQRQLQRTGIQHEELEQAVNDVKETLVMTLESERGQWLLDVAKAYREWTLLDAEGRVSIIDLAISQEDHWLIVDYKTAKPYPGQSEAQFIASMKARYADQLRRYCAQVSALDGRQAVAALYFPRASLWCPI